MTGTTDQVITMPGMNPFMGLTNEPMQTGDWAKGAAGTGECSFTDAAMYYPLDIVVGCLAESWELGPDPTTTMIWHIRKGVRFHDKPPASGREMTAYDVAFSLKRNWETRTSFIYSMKPYEEYVASITATDKWTVEIKMKKPGTVSWAFYLTTDYSYTYPPEVIEKYGNMSDWRNCSGTGPFVFGDYVSGSSARFVKNPNYWGTDPLHPENRLPYLDTVQFILMSDASTRIAAVRTHKVDVVRGLSWEDAKGLMTTNPELMEMSYVAGTVTPIWLRVDTKPFDDIRVRQALEMGVDKIMIKDLYYGGNADLMVWPLAPIPEYKGLYWELKDLPQSVRELYEYQPDKAKQLLKEAGYPNGFSIEVVCLTGNVDLLSVVKDNWAKIGVDLRISSKEYAVHQSMGINHTYAQTIMIYTNQPNSPLKYTSLNPQGQMNYAVVNDPKVNELIERTEKLWPDERTALKEYSKMVPYVLEQSFCVQLPTTRGFVVWQPWVKTYYGENSIGSCHPNNFVKYIWIDQELQKKIMESR
jgi:peptide/nickel transport system substrate-binding protein